MSKSSFGVIGLGVMGSSLSLNIAEKGYEISVYNRATNGEENVVADFLKRKETSMKIDGFTDLKLFIDSLERPRKVLIMVKAGNAIDTIIKDILPLLSKGDVIIDGGNSHFLDSKRRTKSLKEHNINFVGCGVSGGEEGARKGPAIMPGGSVASYKIIAPILEAISAKDLNNKPCCTFIGNDGAGHFVKMVHNGIEYAEMQLLAELYQLLSLQKTNLEIAAIFKSWNTTHLASYLLEITIAILEKKENDISIVDTILDKAGNKGTGSWSSQTAFDVGTVNTMMSSAVFARYISSFKSQRIQLSKIIENKDKQAESISEDTLKNAYYFAKIINHHQGFELMKMAAKEYNWSLNFSEIARIWTNGCIIRSRFMEDSIAIFKEHKSYLEATSIQEKLTSLEKDIKSCISNALENRIPLDSFWASYNYWIAITTERLPANLIQAQRDYFGAHTYQKIGASETAFFHTIW